jgi:hypothetical protein
MNTDAILFFGLITYFIIGCVCIYILKLCGFDYWTDMDEPSYGIRTPRIIGEIHCMLNDPHMPVIWFWPIIVIYSLICFLYRLIRKIKYKIYLSRKAKMNIVQK